MATVNKGGRPKGSTKEKINRSKAGRKAVINEHKLSLLRDAFLLGCTDTEACLKADISPATLYRYQEKNPDYESKKAQWKEQPFLIARQTINKGLETDPKLALAYMERKKKEEFSLKSEMDLTSGGEPVKITGFNYIVPKDRIDDPNTPTVS